MSTNAVGGTLQRPGRADAKTVDLQTSKELDDILNDLLEEAPTNAAFRERTLRKAWGNKEMQFGDPEGCVTTESGDSRTVLTWQTSQSGPTKSVTVSKETITRPTSAFQPETESREWQKSLPTRSADDYDIPDVVKARKYGPPKYKESRTFETHTKSRTADRAPMKKLTSGERVGHPVNTPPNRRRLQSAEFTNNGVVRSDFASPPLNSSHHQQKRTTAHYRQYASDSEEPLTWLEEQRRKLERKRAEGTWNRQSFDRSRSTNVPRSGFSRKFYPQSDTEDFVGPSKPRETLRDGFSATSLDNLNRTPGRHSRTLEPPRFTKEYGDFSRGKQSESRTRAETMDRQYRDDRYEYVASIRRPASATPPTTKYSFTLPPAGGLSQDFGSRTHLVTSAPTSPLIPTRGDSSREAVVRTQGKAKEWLGYAETQEKMTESERLLKNTLRLSSPLKPSADELDMFSLHPIGCGVQDLEPRSERIRGLTRSTPSLFQPQDFSGKRQEFRSHSTLGKEIHHLSPVGQRRNQSFSTLPAAAGVRPSAVDDSSVFAQHSSGSTVVRPMTSLGGPAPITNDPGVFQLPRRVHSTEAIHGTRTEVGQTGGYSGQTGQYRGQQWSSTGQQNNQLSQGWQEKQQFVQPQRIQQPQTMQQQQTWHQQEIRQQQQVHPEQQQNVSYVQQRQQFEQQQLEHQRLQQQQLEQQRLQQQQLEQQRLQQQRQQQQELQRQQFQQQQFQEQQLQQQRLQQQQQWQHEQQFQQQQQQQQLQQQQIQQQQLQQQQLQQQQFQQQQRQKQHWQEQQHLQQPQQHFQESRTVTRTYNAGQNASSEGANYGGGISFSTQGEQSRPQMIHQENFQERTGIKKPETLKGSKHDVAVQADTLMWKDSAGGTRQAVVPVVDQQVFGINQPVRQCSGSNQLVEQVIERRILEREVVGGVHQTEGQFGTNQMTSQMGGQFNRNQFADEGISANTIGGCSAPQQTAGQMSEGQRVRVLHVEGHSGGKQMGKEHGELRSYQDVPSTISTTINSGTQQGFSQNSDGFEKQRTFESSGTRYGTYSGHTGQDRIGGGQYGSSYSQGTGYGTAQRRELQDLQFGVDTVDSTGERMRSGERWSEGGIGSAERTEQFQHQQHRQGYTYESDDGGARRTGTIDGRAVPVHTMADAINVTGGSWNLESANAEAFNRKSATYGHQRGASASFSERKSPGYYLGHAHSTSVTSVPDASDWVNQPPRFVRDTSKYWHKPNLSRDEAINLLLEQEPGSFIVRNSNTFPGSFGLALKVSQVPPSMQTKGGDPKVDLIRHFLIEPTPKGVRLKGSSNEPVFASLAALIYQHSITPLSLPCKLKLPDRDISGSDEFDRASPESQTHGAACTVLYMSSVGTENLTGPEALSRSIKDLFESGRSLPRSTVVQFKVSKEGITLTDNRRKLFFRRFYPIETVTFCGVDPRDRRWTVQTDDVSTTGKAFGFVARKPGVIRENACHVFLELDPTQPANVIVNFVTRILIGQGQRLLQT